MAGENQGMVRKEKVMELKCPGVGRGDKDYINALQFYFNRRVTDDEMRFLHEVMQRSVACMPMSVFNETRIVPTSDGPKGYAIVTGNVGLGQRPALTADKEVSAQADIKRTHGIPMDIGSDPRALLSDQVAIGEDFFVTQARRLGVTVEEIKYGKGVRQTPLTGKMLVETYEKSEKVEPEYTEPWVLAAARADALLPAAVRDVLYVRWTKHFLILEPAITAAEMFQVRRVIEAHVTAKNCAFLYDPAGEYFILRVKECPPADRTFWPTVPAEIFQADHENLMPWQRGLYAKDWGSGRWRLRPEHQAWGAA